MFQEAEKFFTSWGCFPPLLSSGENSMMERPTDEREVECHAIRLGLLQREGLQVLTAVSPLPLLLLLSTCLPVSAGWCLAGR